MSTIDTRSLIELVNKVQLEEDGVVYDYDIGYSAGRKSIVEEIIQILRYHGIWDED